MYKCKVFEHTSNGQVTKTGYNPGRLGSNKLYYYEKGVVGKEAFHIYILAPEGEKAKIGDYVYSFDDNVFSSPSIITSKEDLRIYEEQDHCFNSPLYKVIASTDSSLNLPRPSNEFLKKYCEEGGIDEVMVEYEYYGKDYIHTLEYDNNIQKVKVAPDNTITIRKVKDTWTRKEVEELIEKAYIASWSTAIQYHQNNGSYVSPTEWINKNL